MRLRELGGVLLRVDRESTLHDADMDRFGQWWTRAKRCGHAYAQVSELHGARGEKKFVREMKRAWVLGAVVPGSAALLTVPTLGSVVARARRSIRCNAVRIAMGTRKRGFSWKDAAAWGASCALSPIPQAVGALKFHLDRLRSKRPEIIEYKGPPRAR